MDIQAVELGSKGTVYDTRVAPAGPKFKAADLCVKLNVAGQPCEVDPY